MARVSIESKGTHKKSESEQRENAIVTPQSKGGWLGEYEYPMQPGLGMDARQARRT